MLKYFSFVLFKYEGELNFLTKINMGNRILVLACFILIVGLESYLIYSNDGYLFDRESYISKEGVITDYTQFKSISIEFFLKETGETIEVVKSIKDYDPFISLNVGDVVSISYHMKSKNAFIDGYEDTPSKFLGTVVFICCIITQILLFFIFIGKMDSNFNWK